MKQSIIELIEAEVRELYSQEVKVELTRPEVAFGDYATNVALQLAKPLGKNPRDVAEQIAGKLNHNSLFEKVEVAGLGFINILLSDNVIFKSAHHAIELPQPLKGKIVVAEYSDANPFKALHAGHLYTSLVGDAIANIMEAAGATVYRVNFGGDVGLHVAKAMWSIIRELNGELPDKLESLAGEKKLEWVSGHYVRGNTAYKENDSTKQQITAINQRVYGLHSDNDHTSPFAVIYWTCRQWSYDGFKALYERLHMKPFVKYYPESVVAEPGLQIVRAHVGSVYEESHGAIVFHGEPYGLFTQVFVTSEGLPTYGGKDVGLIYEKHKDFKPDASYIITDVAQKDHLAVVMKSIEQFEPELVKATVHQTHGRIKFEDGSKMSSRTGNVVWANDILDAAFGASQEFTGKSDEQIVLGAVRYSFLKNRIGGDIQYNPQESVSIEGNSGPYLQYALVRARSILRKVDTPSAPYPPDELEAQERRLAQKISLYPEVFTAACNEYSPHHIAGYLYELAQVFNRFYENSRVADDPREALRVSLVKAYEGVLSHGLDVLGMPKPQKM